MKKSIPVARLAAPLLALGCSVFPGVARAEWWQANSGHFIVYSEGSKAEATNFAMRLERYDGALRTLQAMPPGQPIADAAKVVVYRFGDTDDIGNLAGLSGVAGFYIARAAYPVAFTPAREARNRAIKTRTDSRTELNSETVLFHEYTHHFMLRNFSTAYPGWYVEGFAELNSTIDLRDDGSFVVGLPANHRSYSLFQTSALPLRKMLDPAFRYRDGADMGQKYARGWLLTHYLSFGKKRPGQLADYLKALAAGEDGLKAAERVFGDLGKLDSEIEKYKSSRLPMAEVVPQGYTPPQITLRKLSADEERLMLQQIKLARGVSRKQARAMAGDLQAAAAAMPTSYTAQILAAEASLDAADYAGAGAAADRALALDPRSVDALVFKGRSLIEAPSGDPSRFALARPFLVRARKVDPNDPRPLIEYYQSWRRSGQAVPEDALIALEDAFDLAAHDRGYRFLLTRQLVEENRLTPARQVLAPVAYSYDGNDPKSDLAGQAMDKLEANDAAGALELLNKFIRRMEGADEKD